MRSALILEDHDEPRQWLIKLVQEAFPGIETEAAATLAQARVHVAKKEFDLALVDINLPDGSGTELVSELRQSRARTYVVMATIFDDDRHLLPALRAGAQGYLLKDQPRERLLSQLIGISSGQPPLSPSAARRILRHVQQQPPVVDTTAESTLTERETEALNLLARGFNRNEIATAMGITVNTVAGYTKSIYTKLDVSSRAEATLAAVRLGLIDPLA
jgi:DNA-binding NarL/FixJ family response regulator